MTAHFIAKICDYWFNNISFSNTNTDEYDKSIYKYNKANTVLTDYLCAHFLDFVETELVRTYAKDICEHRNKFENWYRYYGWMYNNKIESLKKYEQDYRFYRRLH